MSDARNEAHDSSEALVSVGAKQYRKVSYTAPEEGALYIVRDKAGAERIVQVKAMSQGRTTLELVTIEAGIPSDQTVEVRADSLARQAAKGWCSRLMPAAASSEAAGQSASTEPGVRMRIDSQNFGRCCADVARANIRFSTQLIKDVGDGPFRAGDYEQAFLTFEQLSVGFNSAVGNSRRAIAEGRRKLSAEKGRLSGKEIQERTASFVRSEQLIHTAEREFATILEGLRMYLRAQQNRSAADAASD
jgi:hypothetical protein